MSRLHSNVQIAASIQKQQGSYRAVISVHPEAHSNDNITIVWYGSFLSEWLSRFLLEDMKMRIYGART